jgi:hypothetical protein
MSDEPNNEEEVCQFVIKQLEKRTGQALSVIERPDQVERRAQAVEMVCASASGETFAIEHTRIESFPQQIADGKSFEDLLGPIELGFAGHAPGRFSLTVRVGATTQVRQNERHTVRMNLITWIVAKIVEWDKSAVDVDEPVRVSETPPGVPFEVSLARWHRSGNQLLISRFVPDDLEEQRAARVSVALRRKTAKLAAERARGRTSVLALESNDIALGSAAVIKAALDQALTACADPPDYIYLIETNGRPWYVHLLRPDRSDAAIGN